ncbi:glycine--tRNA ligase subunit beta [Mesobacillus harenae]|uniref:glycine--tRNA ligase subunit beta n=1 Tax=Mesobacillus harenae TaxID=2213203 RepID=UPI0015811F1C|nr:glycine--tRNA ligase subunit beta [Mesobacillus harenae]
MSKRDMLLEVGLEEMPARYVTSSVDQLAQKIEAWLESHGINYSEVNLFSTPRRLGVHVREMDEQQEDSFEEAKGPARKIAVTETGDWSKAAIGFSRGQGMAPEDIYFKEIKGVEYAHVKKYIKGQRTADLLPELESIITGLNFPKNMRWANEELRYIRPIKWLVAMFGQEIIPISITGVSSGTVTYGHRFLGGKIELTNPDDYESQLLSQYVLADSERRKQAILSQIEKLEEEMDWVITVEAELLEEVTNLVEYPTALYGRFEEEFLEIPEEVLITSMKEHQRYFPVKSKEGTLLPYFVTVRNGDHNHLETVAKGNEKVLRARLADAAFFYKEDQKMPIEKALVKLNSIVYHEEIGTLSEKISRVRNLTNQLTGMLQLNQESQKAADRAAEISKFDLVTQMVYEFPELQGFMGQKYALQKGESSLVAQAINEHYMPRNAEDATPESDAGASLAIADKLDTIVSFFSIGSTPTGSQDPYALRRQASGIIQILLKKAWNINFEETVDLAVSLIGGAGIAKRDTLEIKSDLISFFKLRIKHYLQEQGTSHDIIEAVLGGPIGAVPELIKRSNILEAYKRKEGFKSSIEALSRVANIAGKAETPGEINPDLFENEYERQLYNKYLASAAKVQGTIPAKTYFEELISLESFISNYFEHTMVMAEDRELRTNRLSQMAKLAAIIEGFAKVNAIIVK